MSLNDSAIIGLNENELLACGDVTKIMILSTTRAANVKLNCLE